MAEIETFTPEFEGELNIESIISAPLIAASKANVMILTGQSKFILEHCFNEMKDGTLQPKMVEMVLSQSVIDYTKQPTDDKYITIETMNFQVPLLCILPINALGVDNVNVNFDLEITSIASYKSKVSLYERRAVLNGRIAPSHNDCKNSGDNQNQTNSSTRLKVDINVGRLPLTKGLLSLIDLYEKTIMPIQKK